MLRSRISAIFFLLCLIAFSVGSILSFPPYAQGWQIAAPNFWNIIHGETSLAVEKELEDKLTYKDQTTGLWGAIRYGLFNTGSKGVVIGKDEWLFTKEEFEVSDKFEQNLQASHKRIIENIAALQEQGIATLLVSIPAKARFYANRLDNMVQPAEHTTLSFPANVPILDGHQVFSSLKGDAFMRTDTHWSPQAAKAMAQAIKHYLEQHHPELELTSKAFTTTAKPSEPYEGDLAEFIPTGYFKSSIGPKGENFISYQTQAAPSENLDLFADEVIDAVLIGTSYSAQKEWHFEGFLKGALQADVLNLADEGKGPFAPMDAFLERLQKGEQAPKLVIWEFPERFLPRDHEEDKS